MALIKCPECGGTVSNRANSCPHCGNPILQDITMFVNNTNKEPVTFCNRSMLRIGQDIYFGKYPQGHNGEIFPLQWVVLDIKNDRMLILSKKIIEHKNYDYLSEEKIWENSTIRKWLNSQFWNKAFTDYEKRMVITSTVFPDRNPDSYLDPGNETADKVFIMSSKEYSKYSDLIAAAGTIATDYCQSLYFANDTWILRSPGYKDGYFEYIEGRSINDTIDFNRDSFRGIRPVMNIYIE